MLIDKHSPIPLYLQLKDILVTKIQSGEFNTEDPIPAERELQEIYGLSRDTVRKAVLELINDHLLYVDRGRGTFVREVMIKRNISGLRGFSFDMQNIGIQPGQRILSLDRVLPPSRVVDTLGIPKDKEIQRLVRLRLANNRVIALQTAYLPYLDITWDELEEFGSLYQLLTQKYKIVQDWASEIISAIAATGQEAELLGVRIGAPLLRIWRSSFTNRDQPVEFVEAFYRSDSYEHHLRLTK